LKVLLCASNRAITPFKLKLQFWQVVPEYPDGQLHENAEPLDWHVAPFRHGPLKQALTLKTLSDGNFNVSINTLKI